MTNRDSQSPAEVDIAVVRADLSDLVRMRRVSWGAVFVGIVRSLVTHLLLTMVGVGVGIISLDPGIGDTPDPGAFTTTAGIWWVISGIIAAFVGGLTAGRLSGRPDAGTTGWHGLAAWAGTTLVVVYLVTTAAAGLVGGIMSAVGGLAQTAANAAAPLTQQVDPLQALEREVRIETAGDDAAQLQDAAVAAVQAVVTTDEDGRQAARDRAVEALAAAQGITEEEARQQLTQLEADFDQVMANAREAAGDVTDALGTAALFSVFALVLGAGAGWAGGAIGRRVG